MLARESSSRSGSDGPLVIGHEPRHMCAAFSFTLYISTTSGKVLPTWRVGLFPLADPPSLGVLLQTYPEAPPYMILNPDKLTVKINYQTLFSREKEGYRVILQKQQSWKMCRILRFSVVYINKGATPCLEL